MTYTFDIFDTLLTRRFYNHLGIFLYVQDVLVRNHTEYGISLSFAQNFYSVRKYADTEAHKYFSKEVNFTEIYEFIRIYSGISKSSIKKIMSLEIDAEIKFCEPIIENILKAENYLNQGEQVVMLSDMYHSPDVLRQMISKISPLLGTCDIMVSAHHGGSKGSGQLFQSFMKKYNILPNQFCHFGDHIYADHDMPYSMGIHVMPRYTKADRNYYANYLEKFSKSDWIQSSYIGISRVCDLNNELSESGKIGCYIAGPLMYAFIDWVLQAAIEGSKTELFFLGRDGLPLLHIAKKIAEKHKYNINLNYMYISRLSVYKCSIFNYTDEILDFAFLTSPYISLGDIAERLLLTPDMLKACLDENGVSIQKDDQLSDFEIIEIRRILLSSQKLQETSIQNSKTERKALLSYLESINFSFVNATLVDVGWKGSIQDALHRIAQNENISSDITGLYFGVCEMTRFQGVQNKKYGYLIEPSRLNDRTWHHDGVLMFIEIFSHHCEHGTVTGFAMQNNRGGPIFDPVYMGNAIFLEDLHRGVLLFVEKILESDIPTKNTTHFIGNYLRILQEPDAIMAHCLGRYKHLLSTHDENPMEISPSVGVRKILNAIFFGENLNVRWVEGAIHRRSPRAVTLYHLYHKYEDYLQRPRNYMLRIGQVFRSTARFFLRKEIR